VTQSTPGGALSRLSYSWLFSLFLNTTAGALQWLRVLCKLIKQIFEGSKAGFGPCLFPKVNGRCPLSKRVTFAAILPSNPFPKWFCENSPPLPGKHSIPPSKDNRCRKDSYAHCDENCFTQKRCMRVLNQGVLGIFGIVMNDHFVTYFEASEHGVWWSGLVLVLESTSRDFVLIKDRLMHLR
jgi:hypothetical protein